MSKKVKGVKDMDTYNNLHSSLDSVVTDNVTKDDLINPYDLVDPSNYRLNRRGQSQYQADLQKALYMAQLQQQHYQNEYNSPVQDFQRQREAGANPDLLGLSGQSSASGPSASGNPMEGIQTNGEVASTIVSSIMSAIQAASSIYFGAQEGLLNLEFLRERNDAQHITNANDRYEFYKNIMPSSFRVRKVKGEDGKDEILTDYVNLDRMIDLMPTGRGLRGRRNKKRWTAEFDAFANSPEGQLIVQKMQNLHWDEGTKRVKFEASPTSATLIGDGYSEGPSSEVYGNFKSAFKKLAPVLDMALQLEKKKTQAEINKAQYDADYYDPSVKYSSPYLGDAPQSKGKAMFTVDFQGKHATYAKSRLETDYYRDTLEIRKAFINKVYTLIHGNALEQFVGTYLMQVLNFL